MTITTAQSIGFDDEDEPEKPKRWQNNLLVLKPYSSVARKGGDQSLEWLTHIRPHTGTPSLPTLMVASEVTISTRFAQAVVFMVSQLWGMNVNPIGAPKLVVPSSFPIMIGPQLLTQNKFALLLCQVFSFYGLSILWYAS